jgi:hypothetical protein
LVKIVRLELLVRVTVPQPYFSVNALNILFLLLALLTIFVFFAGAV